ncbi:MAG TPA: hypothetical protein VF365_04005 [Candidatus Limnocylindria bacterium]
MRRRLRVGGAAGVGAAVLLLSPAPAAAHAIGGTFQLPVPLWLYLAGAASAVAASFVVTSIVAGRDAVGTVAYPTRPIGDATAATFRALLRVAGLAWWYGAIVVGFVVGDISPLPAVLFWIGVWVGLPIVAVLLGNPWLSLSPFRSTFGAIEWVGRRVVIRRLDAGLPYPTGLARWPAFVLLAAGIWAELVLPGREVAGTVAAIMLAYTLLTLAGMAAFGQIAWLRHAELFEVELGWFGRIGPVGRRSADAELCEGCGEGCDPSRCIDCPECATAAEDGERRPTLRPWIVGLTDVTRAGWSDAAFIVLALAGVSYDGLQETAFGAGLLTFLLPSIQAVFGLTSTTFLVLDTLALIVVVAAFLVAFTVIVLVAHALADPDRRRPLAASAGVYAATLLPIAGGYVIAHYLTLVIQGAVWLPSLLGDPLMSLAPELDWIPTGLVWYLSVASIVGGHVAGIVLAHRLAVRDAPSRAVLAGLPMVALMIGYTVLSLWIIAQPIVVEPGVAPAA